MLQYLQEWGLTVLQAIEQLRSPALNVVFMFFHYLGQEPGYLVLAPVLFWLRRDVTALKLLVGLTVAWYFNTIIKEFVQEPRPFLSAGVTALIEVKDMSFPSGHAQLAAYFYGALALIYRQRWVTMICALVILGIGACRLYLGVHYPHDVLAGYALGFAVSIPMFVMKSKGSASDLKGRMWLAGVLPLAMVLGRPEFSTLKIAGLTGGFLLGFRLGRDPPVRTIRMAASLVLTLVVEVGLYLGLVAIAAEASGPALAIMLTLGYLGLGIWVMRGPDWIGPWFQSDVETVGVER